MSEIFHWDKYLYHWFTNYFPNYGIRILEKKIRFSPTDHQNCLRPVFPKRWVVFSVSQSSPFFLWRAIPLWWVVHLTWWNPPQRHPPFEMPWHHGVQLFQLSKLSVFSCEVEKSQNPKKVGSQSTLFGIWIQPFPMNFLCFKVLSNLILNHLAHMCSFEPTLPSESFRFGHRVRCAVFWEHLWLSRGQIGLSYCWFLPMFWSSSMSVVWWTQGDSQQRNKPFDNGKPAGAGAKTCSPKMVKYTQIQGCTDVEWRRNNCASFFHFFLCVQFGFAIWIQEVRTQITGIRHLDPFLIFFGGNTRKQIRPGSKHKQ